MGNKAKNAHVVVVAAAQWACCCIVVVLAAAAAVTVVASLGRGASGGVCPPTFGHRDDSSRLAPKDGQKGHHAVPLRMRIPLEHRVTTTLKNCALH